jgi:hypothetical protein
MGLTGFVISIATTNVAARYVALFLQAGSYAGYVGNTVKSTWPVMLTRRQLHRFLLVDQFLIPTSSRKACRRYCPHQRIQPGWKHCRILCVVRRSTRLPCQLWHCRRHVWCDNHWSIRIQNHAFEIEQGARPARGSARGDERNRRREVAFEQRLQVSGLRIDADKPSTCIAQKQRCTTSEIPR